MGAEQSIMMLHDKKSLVVTNRVTNPVYTTNTADNDPAVLLTKALCKIRWSSASTEAHRRFATGKAKGRWLGKTPL